MRLMRLCAGVAVGGLVTFGGMGVASAAGAVTLGAKTVPPGGGQIDLLPTPYTNTQPTVVAGPVTLQLLGTQPPPSNGDPASFLANPLPLTVCVMCHP